MNRKETTAFLSDLLVSQKLLGRGIYYASEVTLDYHCGKGKEKRIDFLQFIPVNQTIGGIEQGIFVCYEVKSCKADYHSGNGLNFEGDKNYIVTTMETYKQIQNEIPWGIGVYIACPYDRDIKDEYKNPTPIDDKSVEWCLKIAKCSRPKTRNRSMTQLLFYMLRSGK